MSGSFAHGVHPAEHKEATEHRPIERMPFVDRYTLPLGQNLGKPSNPVVTAGETVARGQIIARPDGFVSTTLHSPVTGRVVGIGPHYHPNGQLVDCIEIEADPYATQQLVRREPVDWRVLSVDSFVELVQHAGIVGMGGAAFPSHVKYRLPEGKRCERLVINGCECEPFLTCDHRLMVERPDAVVHGMEIVASVLDADSVTIGVEMNKPDAIEALRREIGDRAITVVPLHVKYPQGAEKMLIKALFDEEVPAGKLPLDLNIVVNNVASMAAIADAVDHGRPLIERLVTVAGPGVDRPANLLVPVGTPVRSVLRHCGINGETRQVIMGGPMMGMPLATLDSPVLKGTSGLLAFTEEVINHPTEYACVRCGQCLEACGNLLNPQRLARLARAQRWGEMEESYALDCMECGACTYACPSGVPIVHLIRAAKAEIRVRKSRGE
ncbi:MAG: electron transport complex subunit RsxC [Planctomycetes bacterium]|nr:electron transport complex subunit RsxC [Planctomycetota bacterium]